MIGFRERAWQDYLHWQETDKQTLKRINDEHRLVYTFVDTELVIVQCRYHYD